MVSDGGGVIVHCVFFFQAEDGIRDWSVTGVQTCALPISPLSRGSPRTACAAKLVQWASFFFLVVCGRSSRRVIPWEAADECGWSKGGAWKIGRASCRERGESGVVGGAWRREMWEKWGDER